jgi:SAM-dependent methyltransferase
MNIFYDELASWWPLISPVEDYEAEAEQLLRVIEAHAPASRTVLELGSGGGHVAFHLKRRLALTLSDLSAAMLAASARLNPECEHVVGDMRTLDLGRSFDVVLAHDAIDYMTTEAHLEAAIATAHRHLAHGGLAIIVPDHVKERYAPGTECGGADGPDGRAVRYLEWSYPVAAGATMGTTLYSFHVREGDGTVQSFREEHVFGLFPETTWVRILEHCGFIVEIIEEQTDEDRTPRLIFLGRKPGSG